MTVGKGRRAQRIRVRNGFRVKEETAGEFVSSLGEGEGRHAQFARDLLGFVGIGGRRGGGRFVGFAAGRFGAGRDGGVAAARDGDDGDVGVD